MSGTNKEYCKTECSEQCEDDDICNQECIEYCTNNKSKPKSGIFGMLFSGWGLMVTICCCLLLIGACLYFLFKKDSKKLNQYNPQMSHNPYVNSPMQPFYGQQNQGQPFPGQPFPGQQFPGQQNQGQPFQWNSPLQPYQWNSSQ